MGKNKKIQEKKDELDDLIQETIDRIENIQIQPYQNWLSAWSRKIQVDNLHKKLDKLKYKGKRPPKEWSQLNAGKNEE